MSDPAKLATNELAAAKLETARAFDHLLETIARSHLGIETLQTRGRDSLDFHEVGVASVRAALREAFDAGVRAGRNGD